MEAAFGRLHKAGRWPEKTGEASRRPPARKVRSQAPPAGRWPEKCAYAGKGFNMVEHRKDLLVPLPWQTDNTTKVRA